MGDWARLLIFPFLGVKIPKKSHKFSWTAFRGPKNWHCYGHWAKFSENELLIAHFCSKKCQKMPFLMLEIYAKFPLPYFMVYGKKRPSCAEYPLFCLLLCDIWYICDYNIHLTIYLTILSGCYFLTSCSISAKSSTIFFKKAKIKSYQNCYI